ncbi:MAG: hypothetical protein A2Y10_14575 [Planctomycetes bacterium GWF2_41_51]|nr:MAG: hypothetical protein A2Y10_14575 [Planctomycetes bacterium GWF2_41_51]HBG25496.1 hypothetical protein [Phycisphaerales bacterium]
MAVCAVILGYNPKPAISADPGDDTATCAISVTVDTIIEWEGANFAAIDLDAQEGHLTAQSSSPEGTSVYTLWTNCNLTLSADNTATAQLTHQRGGGANEDALVTKYKLSTDGAGVIATGATVGAVGASGSNAYVLHNLFLATPLDITHFNTDGAVEVTLDVEATHDTDNVADSGLYEATQTITAAWASDN